MKGIGGTQVAAVGRLITGGQGRAGAGWEGR